MSIACEFGVLLNCVYREINLLVPLRGHFENAAKYPIFAGNYQFISPDLPALIFYLNQLRRCYKVEKYKNTLRFWSSFNADTLNFWCFWRHDRRCLCKLAWSRDSKKKYCHLVFFLICWKYCQEKQKSSVSCCIKKQCFLEASAGKYLVLTLP